MATAAASLNNTLTLDVVGNTTNTTAITSDTEVKNTTHNMDVDDDPAVVISVDTTNPCKDIDTNGTNTTSTQIPTNNSNRNEEEEEEDHDIIERTLYRLTSGLPKRELQLILQETNDCEIALLEEIRMLEAAAALLISSANNGNGIANINNSNDTKIKDSNTSTETTVSSTSDNETTATTEPKTVASVTGRTTTTATQLLLNSMLESPITPLDRFYTTSALLGRLRNDTSMVVEKHSPQSTTTTPVTNDDNATRSSPTIDNDVEKVFAEFLNPSSPFYTVYTEKIVTPDLLLTLWKTISMNRAAFVFKRPVKSEEAPGYTDRIYFPMDLSLIRKRIITNNLQTYIDFHNALALVSHNCVKYNGRETDYGRVARDFEAMVDHVIIQAVRQAASNTEELSDENEADTKGDNVSLMDIDQLQGTPIAQKDCSMMLVDAPEPSIDQNTTIAAVAVTTETITTTEIPTPNDNGPTAPPVPAGNETVADAIK